MSHLHRQLAAQALLAEKPAECTAATLCDPVVVAAKRVAARKTRSKKRGKAKA